MKLKSLRKTLIVVAIAGTSVFGRAQVSSTNMENALMAEGLTQQRAQEILAAFVPIGGVIPYFGVLPLATNSNWQVCDGADLRPNTNPLLSARLGGKAPDLRRQFLFGAQSEATVGNKGGTNNTLTVGEGGSHEHLVPSHAHTVSGFTGGIASSVNPSDNQPYGAVYNAQGHIDWARLETTWVGTGGKTVEGQHMHTIPYGYAGMTSEGGSILTASNHTHTVDLSGKLPPYTEAVFIIRIY